MPYIDETQLSNALGPSTYLAIFDDDVDGVVDASAVTLVILRAHARVRSRLVAVLKDMPPELPAAVDPLLVSVELDYAVALSFERHPEYVRSAGAGKTSPQELRADATMEDIVSAQQQLLLTPTQVAPLTVGGAFMDTSHRVALDNTDGSRNTGDF